MDPKNANAAQPTDHPHAPPAHPTPPAFPNTPPAFPKTPEIPHLLTQPVQRPASMQPKPNDGIMASVGEVGKALSIGIDFLATAAAGGVIGLGIDWLASSMPVATVIGCILGFAVGTWRLIRRLSRQI